MSVDWRTVASLVGTVTKALAVPLVLSAAVALLYRESTLPFLAPAAGSLVIGLGLERLPRQDIGIREAFLMVSLTWLVVAFVGAVPFYLVGTGVFGSTVNAVFESMSGITTTGATVVVSFETHPRGLLFWRQLVQWLGGLGILVLAVGLLSQLEVGGAQLMETETQTQDVTKLTPRISQTARLIGGLYVAMTALVVAVLLALNLVGLAPEMGPYNAVAHALTSISTAGFSPEPESVGAFSPAVQWVIIAAMLVGATNFVLLYALVRGRFNRLRQSEELWFYLGVVAAASALLFVVLEVDIGFGPIEPTLRHAVFQVTSIVTTTGYATVDFDLWSPAAKHLLFLGMFVGGMAGSTTCSIKSFRWLVVVKTLRRDLFTEIHPDAIRPIRVGGTVVDEGTIRDVNAYVVLSLLIFAFLTVFVVVETSGSDLGITEFDAMGIAAATFLNIGPAFGVAGPYGSYAGLSATTKWVLVVLMWVGRIEIVPVLVVLTPTFWRS
ncbi:TrkH family potassium uptake protein [Salinirubellus sp. GCM10025818]|uniref:TrkH family potassium uptake protein n=1 Tax=Salinirubellus TaxID=2162630 RepID=UPI0030CB2F3D